MTGTKRTVDGTMRTTGKRVDQWRTLYGTMRTKTGTKRTMGRTMEKNGNNGNKEWNNEEQ